MSRLEGAGEAAGRSLVAAHAALDEVRAELRGKAGAAEVRACVLRAHFEEAVLSLGRTLDTRASELSVARVAGELAEARALALREAGRLDVAMRFVAWFSGRGEAYEHNLRAVDKHLRALTEPAKTRLPFAGAARVTDQELQRGRQSQDDGRTSRVSPAAN